MYQSSLVITITCMFYSLFCIFFFFFFLVEYQVVVYLFPFFSNFHCMVRRNNKIHLMVNSFFLILGLVFWSGWCDLFVFQNPREFYVSHSLGQILDCAYVIFWPSTRPKNAIPRWCTGRKWHIQMASNRKRSRGRIKAYNMGQGEGSTVPLQWCTGREWPVNCMTVISAWWRLNIRFQRSSGRSCGRWIII